MSLPALPVEHPPALDSQRRRVVECAADWLAHLSPAEMARVLSNIDTDTVVLLGQRAERELGRWHLRRWR